MDFLSDKFFQSEKKKAKLKGITANLKRQVWERHIGIGVLESACPLCGTTRIFNGVNSGWNLCHIVSQRYLNEDLTLLYSYPGCASCNNECSDMCVLDYLWCRGRLKQLKKLIMSIYDLFLLLHGDELAQQDKMAWKVMDHLYAKKFPAGGGIQNKKQIFELARVEQYKIMSKEAVKLSTKLAVLGEEMQQLMECKIETLNLF